MGTATPTPELDQRYSSGGAPPTAWDEARERLIRADVYWISTVRGDGRPHVRPLLAVWADGAMHVSTGPLEQKARNLAANPHCILTTGTGSIEEGLDVVLEGTAERVTGRDRLAALAGMWVAKYGEVWRFRVWDDEGFHHREEADVDHDAVPDIAHVFAIRPDRVFAFRKGAVFSQTRYRLSG
jgi:general stress protein 26